MHAKTVTVDNGGQPVWQQGDRKLWNITVQLDNGQLGTVKTYSGAIAKVGFEGEIEPYDKDGRNGLETFVRQWQDPNKQQNFTQGQQATARSNNGGGSKSYQARDDAAIQAQWAIGQAVQVAVMLAKVDENNQPKWDKIEADAKYFFHMIQRVKTSAEPAEPAPAEITAAFGGGENYEVLGEENNPWANNQNQQTSSPLNQQVTQNPFNNPQNQPQNGLPL